MSKKQNEFYLSGEEISFLMRGVESMLKTAGDLQKGPLNLIKSSEIEAVVLNRDRNGTLKANVTHRTEFAPTLDNIKFTSGEKREIANFMTEIDIPTKDD